MFDIISRVSIPIGTSIEIDPQVCFNILHGRAPGEIIKEGDRFILRTRKIVTGKAYKLNELKGASSGP